jgi:hypothetical protein
LPVREARADGRPVTTGPLLWNELGNMLVAAMLVPDGPKRANSRVVVVNGALWVLSIVSVADTRAATWATLFT